MTKKKFELILTVVKIANKKIRIITGYGPQENWKDEDKIPFFVSLEKEIVNALAED